MARWVVDGARMWAGFQITSGQPWWGNGGADVIEPRLIDDRPGPS